MTTEKNPNVPMWVNANRVARIMQRIHGLPYPDRAKLIELAAALNKASRLAVWGNIAQGSPSPLTLIEAMDTITNVLERAGKAADDATPAGQRAIFIAGEIRADDTTLREWLRQANTFREAWREKARSYSRDPGRGLMTAPEVPASRKWKTELMGAFLPEAYRASYPDAPAPSPGKKRDPFVTFVKAALKFAHIEDRSTDVTREMIRSAHRAAKAG